MKSCECCKHLDVQFYRHPCDRCYFTYEFTDDRPNWEPDDHISGLIESAEQKAFQAGWEHCIDLCEAGEIRGYMNEDFEKWKESK